MTPKKQAKAAGSSAKGMRRGADHPDTLPEEKIWRLGSKEIIDACGISQQAINALSHQGILPKAGYKGYPALEFFKAFIAYQRTAHGGRKAADPEARARLTSAQADLAEVKLARERGDLLAASDVLKKWSAYCTTLRQGMLAIPSRMRSRNPLLTLNDAEMMADEIRAALEEGSKIAD